MPPHRPPTVPRRAAPRVIAFAALVVAVAGADAPSPAPAALTAWTGDRAPGAPRPGVATAAGCLDSIPDSLLTRRDTLYLHALILSSAAYPLMPEADVLAQSVAFGLRRLLGGRRDSLPTGEPLIGWRNAAKGNVAVVLHRDGHATWTELMAPPYRDTLAMHALAGAVAVVEAEGAPVRWGEESPLDSVTIRLAFDAASGSRYEVGVGQGFAAFAQRAPRETRPTPLSYAPVRYPSWLRDSGVTGHLMMQAVIDTLGRAEPASIKDVWPSGYPRFQGARLQAYEAFVAATRDALLKSRFAPGRIGDCLVRVLVRIPANFTLNQ